MVSLILMLSAIIIFMSIWFHFELKKTKEQVRKWDGSLHIFLKKMETFEQELYDLGKIDSGYVRKEHLFEELDKYYDEVEKRIKARKEEVWKSREKAFSMTKVNP